MPGCRMGGRRGWRAYDFFWGFHHRLFRHLLSTSTRTKRKRARAPERRLFFCSAKSLLFFPPTFPRRRTHQEQQTTHTHTSRISLSVSQHDIRRRATRLFYFGISGLGRLFTSFWVYHWLDSYYLLHLRILMGAAAGSRGTGWLRVGLFSFGLWVSWRRVELRWVWLPATVNMEAWE